MSALRNRKAVYEWPQQLCVYRANEGKVCYNFNKHPDRCKDCSSNPNRFDGKKMTRGQEIFLIEGGYYKPEEIVGWDFKKASEVINKLKN